MKVKEESGKSWLKIQHSEKLRSGLITSWQIDGKTTETVRDFILGGLKIIADGAKIITAAMKLKDACSLEENT